MGREVRMVPPGWQHPTRWVQHWRTGQPELQHVPLLKGSYTEEAASWDEAAAQWDKGYVEDYSTYRAAGWKPKEEKHDGDYASWAGDRPSEADYMPIFEPETATLLVMYENTSEGTPISPAFATPEELARWLADNNASAFGDDTATYDQWLSTIKAGRAPSAVFTLETGLTSGVAALAAPAPAVEG